ncbi:hypothetical protein ABPG72_017004 [Tetrahymena utriculariae]
MVFNPDIDQKTKFLVIYHHVTQTATRIAKLISVPVRTIYDWIKKIKNDQDIFKIEGRGRKPQLSKQQEKSITKEVKLRPHSSSTRKLASRENVSKTTIGKVFAKNELEYKSVMEVTELTEEQKQQRVNYCKKMLKRKGQPLNETIFTDETGVYLSDCHKSKVWTPKGKKIKIELPKKDLKVNCWGGISYEGATSLHIFEGSLNKEVYQEILEKRMEEMESLYPDGFEFMHDNHPVHSSLEIWGEEQGLNIIDFPPYSPDLNPIENLWAVLKNKVAADNPKTYKQLEDSLYKNWEILTQIDTLRPFIEGLQNRYSMCIENKGERLNH